MNAAFCFLWERQNVNKWMHNYSERVGTLMGCLLHIMCSFQRISMEGALLSQAEALLSPRKKFLSTQKRPDSNTVAYSSDQEDGAHMGATDQTDADDEEETEQVNWPLNLIELQWGGLS